MRVLRLISVAFAAASVAALLTSPAYAAVDVAFVAPDGYSDGGSKSDLLDLPTRATVEREIRAHLVGLGERNLGPNQSLKIEILDIDLAGRRDVLGAGARDIRVHDQATPPRIKLRFSLEENGKTIASGEDTLMDPLYLNSIARPSNSDPLRYERPMLTKWFLARIVERKPGG
jgi:hypothetical protein